MSDAPARYHCHKLAARHASGYARIRGLGYTHGYDDAQPETPSSHADAQEYEDAYLRGMHDRAAVARGTYTRTVPDSRKRPPILV